MDRSRSKSNYYYDQDFDSETLGRSNNKPLYNHHYANNNNNSNNGHHYRRDGVGGGGGGGGGRSAELQDASAMVTMSYMILCHDMKAGGVIGKSSSIIKSIRQHTDAWINVHELILGDEERIIEISDTRRRDLDGRMLAFSSEQEALLFTKVCLRVMVVSEWAMEAAKMRMRSTDPGPEFFFCVCFFSHRWQNNRGGRRTT